MPLSYHRSVAKFHRPCILRATNRAEARIGEFESLFHDTTKVTSFVLCQTRSRKSSNIPHLNSLFMCFMGYMLIFYENIFVVDCCLVSLVVTLQFYQLILIFYVKVVINSVKIVCTVNIWTK